MKLPKECVYCRHKFECTPDANDGLGLEYLNTQEATLIYHKHQDHLKL